VIQIEKSASFRAARTVDVLDLNHTRETMLLVSLLIPKFAWDASLEVKRTSETGH
jgi:hypothetical protein